MNEVAENIGDLIGLFTTRITSSNDGAYHYHNFYEVFVVTEGEIGHYINGKTSTLHEGDCYLICPGTAHKFIRKSGGAPAKHHDFCIQSDVYRRCAYAIDEPYFQSFEKEGAHRFRLSAQDILYLEEKSTKLLSVYEEKEWTRMATATISSLLSILVQSEASSEEDVVNSSDPFRQSISFTISDNYVFPDSAKRIRESVGYNDKYFCKKFKKTFGTSLINYVNERKMVRARNLLLLTSDPIKIIASEVGIDSASYFHKLFYRTFHETPDEARKNRGIGIGATPTKPKS